MLLLFLLLIFNQLLFCPDATAPVLTFTQAPTKTNGSPRFTWISTEIADFECSLDNRRFESCGKGKTGQWFKQNVRNGIHIFKVRGTDDAGNVGTTVSHRWTVGKVLI